MFTNVTFLQKEPLPPLVKIREVARLLSVSRHTVHNLIQSGDLSASEVNPRNAKSRRHRRITLVSLQRFYQRRFGHPLKAALANPFDP